MDTGFEANCESGSFERIRTQNRRYFWHWLALRWHWKRQDSAIHQRACSASTTSASCQRSKARRTSRSARRNQRRPDVPDGCFQVRCEKCVSERRNGRRVSCTKSRRTEKKASEMSAGMNVENLPPPKELVAMYCEHATSRKCAGGRSMAQTAAPWHPRHSFFPANRFELSRQKLITFCSRCAPHESHAGAAGSFWHFRQSNRASNFVACSRQ